MFDAAGVEVASVDRIVAEILRIGVAHRIRERAITVISIKIKETHHFLVVQYSKYVRRGVHQYV